MIVQIKENVYEITETGKDALRMYKKVDDKIKEAKMPDYEVLDYRDVYNSMALKLQELTGSKQAVGFNKASFIPSFKDFQEHLLKFKRKYPTLWQPAKIKEGLMKHVEQCAKTKEFVPAIKYYIYTEEKGSNLAAYVELGGDTSQEEQYKIVDTKNLFE